MADYIAYTLTDVGRNLIARVISGETLTFKRIAIGDGFDYDTSHFQERTALVNEVLSIDALTKEDVTDDKIIIKGTFTQQDLEEEFYYREIGLFVVDPDDEDNELLFLYGNKNDKAELIIPSTASYVVSKDLRLYIAVGRTENVNIYISDKDVTNVVEFTQSDWVLDNNTGTYSIYLGRIKESLKVFRYVNGAKLPVPMSNIVRTGSNETTIQAMLPFDGCVTCV